MSIVITNVTSANGGVYGKGEQTYRLMIGDKILCSFKHNFEDGLKVCLEKAARAAESVPWPGSWEGKRNRIKCLKCGDVIEARHNHDFKSCECGFVSIDGGALGHWRRLWKEGRPEDAFREMP